MTWKLRNLRAVDLLDASRDAVTALKRLGRDPWAYRRLAFLGLAVAAVAVIWALFGGPTR